MRVVAVAAVAAAAFTACAGNGDTIPRCDSELRLAIIAQSVPGASYVPCIGGLPTGWDFVGLVVDHEGATISLESDRADRRVDVELSETCDVGSATPIAPSDEGMRTYQLIESIEPRYAGRFIDVFPGGCIVTTYDFERGPHVALVNELQQAVDVHSRRELRHTLAVELDVTLDP